MPLGVVSDEEFESELGNSGVPLIESHTPARNNGDNNSSSVFTETGQVIEMPTPGRKEGDVNVPPALRKVIGETSVMEGRSAALQFAESLGISASSVSAYTNSATSTATYNKKDKELVNHINGRKSKVVGGALTRLTRAMNALTSEKIEASSAKEISGIAKDMASVVKLMDITEDENRDKVPTTQFVVYAPTMIDERKFEVIQAKE